MPGAHADSDSERDRHEPRDGHKDKSQNGDSVTCNALFTDKIAPSHHSHLPSPVQWPPETHYDADVVARKIAPPTLSGQTQCAAARATTQPRTHLVDGQNGGPAKRKVAVLVRLGEPRAQRRRVIDGPW